MIAALAAGVSLAVASSASAIQIPMGSPSAAPYSGSGTPTSIYSLYNASSDALILAENLIYGTGIDPTNFNKAFTSPSDLNSTNVPQIAADFAVTASSNQHNFYALDTAWCETPTANGGAGQSSAVCTSNSGVPPATVTAEFTGTVQPGVASAAASWPELSGLVTNLGSVSSVLNSADSATVTSSGKVVSTTRPMAYNINVHAPAGGYILPSAFSLTFPAGLAVNVGLVADEVNAAANGTSPSAIAAIEANPSGTPIGAVRVTSPVADELGGANDQLVGKVYVLTTGAISGQGSATQPDVELWLAPGIYDMGSFPSTLTFPLALSFGEAMTPLGQEPLPFSSLAVSFPPATSPVKATSCTRLGTVGGTATDAIAGLAYEFGDTGDGVSSPTGTPAAVTLSARATAITDLCDTATAFGRGLTTTHPILRVRIRTRGAFRMVTLGLPRGLRFVKSKRLAKEVRVARLKSARIAHGKLVITLRRFVKLVTIQTRRPLIYETPALIRSIRRHKTKQLTLRVRAGRANMVARFKA